MKTDAELQQDVMNELKWEPTLRAVEIGVAVKDGVVTLSGYVDSYAKKLVAERAAALHCKTLIESLVYIVPVRLTDAQGAGGHPGRF